MKSFPFFMLLFLWNTTGLTAQKATIHFQIIDKTKGILTPARLTVLKDGVAADLKVTSKLHIATRGNTLYTASGSGVVELEPGDYEFWFSKGMEYSIDTQHLSVKTNEVYFLNAMLEKVLNTDGFISGDLHLHTYTNSGHGDANLIERVISCTAEGLDWAVATDHNYITDYQPYLETAGLNGLMKTTVGNELSTDIGHFNIYPLQTDAEALDHKPIDGNILFENVRNDAGAKVVIQINHPRWVAKDYFNTKGLDPYFGTIKNETFSWDFDAFEVLNENYQLGWIAAPDNLQSVKRDWFNLLNQNIRKTGLGNSDSHSVVSTIAGVPRNYIVSSTDLPSGIDEWEMAGNIKAQKVSVACGLFPQLLVNGENAMGGSYSAADKALGLQLRIQAPGWVDCSRAELIQNGVVVQHFDLKNTNKNILRLDTVVSLKPQRDSWYLLIAYGEKSMYPLVGKVERPVYPLGFTNPVWVKADHKESFQSVFAYAKQVAEQNDAPSILKTMEKEPDIVRATIYHLFENKNKKALSVASGFIKQADTEQKRLLFRELAKTEFPGASELLLQFQKEVLNPLEEITLASYIHYPIRPNKVEQFKKRNKEGLDDQLNFLETEYRYLHSGALQQKVEFAFAAASEKPMQWTEQTAEPDGYFYFPKKENGLNYIKTHWRLLKDTSLTFYVNSNVAIQASVNGIQVPSITTNHRNTVIEKLITINMQKGNNDLIFQFSAEAAAQIAFYHSDKKLLIDPKLIIEEVRHLALNAPVQYLTEYHSKYHGHGTALTDGYRGTKSYNTQLWQGWSGENAAFVIDLGKTTVVKKIDIGVLSDQGAWIFFPKKVEYFASVDGKQYTSIYEKSFGEAVKMDGAKIKTIHGAFQPAKARYLKVVVTPIAQIPNWHKSKGEKAWLFLDEVVINQNVNQN